MSQVSTASQDPALFYVYFAHSACSPCGVYYVAPSLDHVSIAVSRPKRKHVNITQYSIIAV